MIPCTTVSFTVEKNELYDELYLIRDGKDNRITDKGINLPEQVELPESYQNSKKLTAKDTTAKWKNAGKCSGKIKLLRPHKSGKPYQTRFLLESIFYG